MRNLSSIPFGVGACLLTAASLLAQPPGPPPRDGGPRDSASGDATSFVGRLMTFDANQDGELAKSEVTDARLQPLFARADADGNGSVTKDELNALFAKESAALGSRMRGRPGGDGPRGRGGPGGGPGPRRPDEAPSRP